MASLESLIKWYSEHKRELPWRQTTDPYLIWLSEVIMQQTRVEQGLPYYIKFAMKYPDIISLAAADEDEVMKLWQGLGYYSRASNMLKTARFIVEEHKGQFPDTYDKLLLLKGIGPYTAAAISSFAFNEKKAVVDGNVYRVLSRLFAIDEPVNSTKGKKLFAQVATDVLNKKDPATHNQAMMELGAIICKPKQALCSECILRLQCMAFKQNEVYRFPVKEKKRKPVNRYLNYIFINDKGHTYIRQRNNEGIWNKLFEFPVIETEQEVDESQLLNSDSFRERFPGSISRLVPVYSAKHQLTHQTIYAVFWQVEGKQIKPLKEMGFMKVDLAGIHNYAVPRLLERFINHILPHK